MIGLVFSLLSLATAQVPQCNFIDGMVAGCLCGRPDGLEVCVSGFSGSNFVFMGDRVFDPADDVGCWSMPGAGYLLTPSSRAFSDVCLQVKGFCIPTVGEISTGPCCLQPNCKACLLDFNVCTETVMQPSTTTEATTTTTTTTTSTSAIGQSSLTTIVSSPTPTPTSLAPSSPPTLSTSATRSTTARTIVGSTTIASTSSQTHDPSHSSLASTPPTTTTTPTESTSSTSALPSPSSSTSEDGDAATKSFAAGGLLTNDLLDVTIIAAVVVGVVVFVLVLTIVCLVVKRLKKSRHKKRATTKTDSMHEEDGRELHQRGSVTDSSNQYGSLPSRASSVYEHGNVEQFQADNSTHYADPSALRK